MERPQKSIMRMRVVFPRAVLRSGLVGAFARLDEESLESPNTRDSSRPSVTSLNWRWSSARTLSSSWSQELQAPAMQLKAARHLGLPESLGEMERL